MNERPTPVTDAVWDALNRQTCGLHYVAHKMRDLERQRDEAMEQCDINATQLLKTVNDRNSLGAQLDLLRDEFRRIAARIGESGLGENPYLSNIADYCQRAQKDIAVRYTPIEERDRACERLAVVMLQLEDCKAQRDQLLEALGDVLASACPNRRDNPAMFLVWESARAAIVAVKG